jgi:hypothetical protein
MNTRALILVITLLVGCKATIPPSPPKRISPSTPTIAVRADAPDWLKEAVAGSARTLRNECLERIPLDILDVDLHDDPAAAKKARLFNECILASATAADVARTAMYMEARETCVRDRAQCCFTRATADISFERKERERCDVDCAEQLHIAPKMLGRRECHPTIIDEPPHLSWSRREHTPAVEAILPVCTFDSTKSALCKDLPSQFERTYCTRKCSDRHARLTTALLLCVRFVREDHARVSCSIPEPEMRAQCEERCRMMTQDQN